VTLLVLISVSTVSMAAQASEAAKRRAGRPTLDKSTTMMLQARVDGRMRRRPAYLPVLELRGGGTLEEERRQKIAEDAAAEDREIYAEAKQWATQQMAALEERRKQVCTLT